MEDEKSIEVTFKFLLPAHEQELSDFQSGSKYARLLSDMDNVCRSVLKYEQEPSEGRESLAEEIRTLICESGAMDI